MVKHGKIVKQMKPPRVVHIGIKLYPTAIPLPWLEARLALRFLFVLRSFPFPTQPWPNTATHVFRLVDIFQVQGFDLPAFVLQPRTYAITGRAEHFA
jgi:hypothetical protein